MHYSLRKSAIALGLVSALAMSPAQAVSPDELFEVLQRIESLENEVRFLRGENEQLRYDLEDVKSTQKSTFIRIDDRMDDLFRAVNSSTSRMSAPAVAPKALPITPAVEKKAVEAKPLQAVKVAPTVVPLENSKPVAQVSSAPKLIQVAAKQPAASSVEQAAYKAALAKVKTHPSGAIYQLRGFLKKYPQSPLAANAQYWLGEVMYSSRNYQGAIDEFVTVLQSYRNSPKAADAAIKLGYSFYEMKNWVYARRTLEDVLRNYPKTSAAELAQARLDKMKTENLY